MTSKAIECIEKDAKCAYQISRARALIDAIIELTDANKAIRKADIEAVFDVPTVYEIARKHDMTANLMFTLADILAELDSMT